jgi:hypothetical protein
MASLFERFKQLFQTHSPISGSVLNTQEQPMDKARFKERILETENLTDELEDIEANWLLNWGISHLDDVLGADPIAAGDRVNALMAVMRKINRIAGNYASKDPQDLVEDLSSLNDLYLAAFGPVETAKIGSAANTVEELAARLPGMPVHEVVVFLTDRSQVSGFRSQMGDAERGK